MDNYLSVQQSRLKYQKKYVNSNSNCDTYANSYNHANCTYSPDLNLHRRIYNPSAPELEHPARQRRWSDSNAKCNNRAEYGDSIYTPPNGFGCECAQCRRANLTGYDGTRTTTNPNYSMLPANTKQARPKVSFGPLFMYSNDTPGPYNSEIKSSKNKKNNDLTTEMLPLDSQIPMMMSDSAMICNII